MSERQRDWRAGFRALLGFWASVAGIVGYCALLVVAPAWLVCAVLAVAASVLVVWAAS